MSLKSVPSAIALLKTSTIWSFNWSGLSSGWRKTVMTVFISTHSWALSGGSQTVIDNEIKCKPQIRVRSTSSPLQCSFFLNINIERHRSILTILDYLTVEHCKIYRHWHQLAPKLSLPNLSNKPCWCSCADMESSFLGALYLFIICSARWSWCIPAAL